MNIHEYQAKAVLREFGVPVPKGIAAFTVEEAMKAAGVPNEGHIYPGAGHGFNNDASAARYNKAAADAAWKRTIEWFNMYVAKK